MKVSNVYSNEFCVKVGIHWSLLFNLFVFILALSAIIEEFKVVCSWDLLYVDDLYSRMNVL